MSKNVCVIPKKYSHGTTFYRSHGLGFNRADYDKYSILDDKALPLPKDWTVYDESIEEGERDSKEDCYGDPIKMISAEEFVKIYKTDDLTTWDQACIAFLEALDPDTLCALYYH